MPNRSAQRKSSSGPRPAQAKRWSQKNAIQNVFYLSSLRINRIGHGFVPAFSPKSVFIVRARQLHFHLAIASVITIVGGAIRDQILRPKLCRNFSKGSFHRQNVSGKERRAAGFCAQS